MKNIKPTAEEQEYLDSYEDEERVSYGKEKMDMLRETARNTLRKNQRINIRMSSKDLMDIQTVAAQEGIPYQTLISSIIHKYATGALTESNTLLLRETPVKYSVSPAKRNQKK